MNPWSDWQRKGDNICTDRAHFQRTYRKLCRQQGWDINSALTSVSLLTHRVGVCLRRAFERSPTLATTCPPRHLWLSRLPSKGTGTAETKRGFKLADHLLDFRRGETDRGKDQPTVRQNIHRSKQTFVGTKCIHGFSALNAICVQNIEPVGMKSQLVWPQCFH